MFVLKLQPPRTKVKIKGTGLSASFAESIPPTLWHCDLANHQGFVLSVQEEGTEWALKQRSNAGHQTIIAHFRHKEAAADAYQALQHSLTRREWLSHGIARAIGMTMAIMLTIGIVILLFASLFGGGKTPATLSGADLPSGLRKPTELQHGVPQSADDILQLPSP